MSKICNLKEFYNFTMIKKVEAERVQITAEICILGIYKQKCN